MALSRRAVAVLIALAPLAPDTGVQADEEVAPYPYVTASEDGRCYFKMIPAVDAEGRSDREKGSGAAFRVGAGGQDEELWRVEGWYAFKTELSRDGRYLVRIGNWPRGRMPSDDHLAIAFYDRGVLLKSYSTKDLIRSPEAVRPTVSHYHFGRPLGFEPPPDERFRLQTVDGLLYTFDVTTGAIVSADPEKP